MAMYVHLYSNCEAESQYSDLNEHSYHVTLTCSTPPPLPHDGKDTVVYILTVHVCCLCFNATCVFLSHSNVSTILVQANGLFAIVIICDCPQESPRD